MANTIASDLKRNAIIGEMRAFAKRLAPLAAFSTAFKALKLEGTDKATIPYYNLESADSVDFDDSDGYVMNGSATDSRTVTIDRRLYQPLAKSSRDVRRQPAVDWKMLVRLKLEKLAADVLTDILGAITFSSFGAAVFTGAASTFNSDAVASLKLACKTWPQVGRSLVVDSAYDANLLKDSAIKNSLAFGPEGIREGQVRRLMGFDYQECPTIPTVENLVGFCAHPAAMAIAFSPVPPSDEVRSNLFHYEEFADEQTGLTICHRIWSNPDMDESREILEISYGFEVCNADACKRLVSA